MIINVNEGGYEHPGKGRERKKGEARERKDRIGSGREGKGRKGKEKGYSHLHILFSITIFTCHLFCR